MLDHMNQVRAQAAAPKNKMIWHASLRSKLVTQRRESSHEPVRFQGCRPSDEDVQDGLSEDAGHACAPVVLEAQGKRTQGLAQPHSLLLEESLPTRRPTGELHALVRKARQCVIRQGSSL
jgi:hypothetical protein